MPDDAVLMLTSTHFQCRPLDMPIAGASIKLEEAAAFDGRLESVSGALERGSWLRSVPSALSVADREVCRRARRVV
jgi:hypothetical protein